MKDGTAKSGNPNPKTGSGGICVSGYMGMMAMRARFVAIGDAASILSVCVKTLRRWDKRGKLKPAFRTAGGTRRDPAGGSEIRVRIPVRPEKREKRHHGGNSGDPPARARYPPVRSDQFRPIHPPALITP